jgi:DNA helicase-2/ATP-dependent DNA helicase PcrA
VEIFKELNEAQSRAVMKTEGPLLVLAGAGAGKTKTVTYRILNLIKKGVAPEEILAVTFTNKAAKEMRERINRLLSENSELQLPITMDQTPFVATFHSLGAFIIKENAGEVGLKKHFGIYDREDSKRAVKEALEKNNLNPKEFDPSKILNIISREKGNFVGIEEYLERGADSYFGEVVAKVWQEYEKILKKENSLDFDDLLLVTGKLLQKDEIRKKYGQKWRYVHIDEYQDTNKVQYAIAEAIVRDHQNICAVGDIDQNIYSWRGANIKNIMNFERDYKGAELVVLEENYRSTKTILAVANKAIEKNKYRREKILVTKNGVGENVSLFEAMSEEHEAQFVVEKIKELEKKGANLSDIAVLYRANFQSRVLEEQFLKKEVPYQILGTRFFDRKEIKDILAFLRFAFNPDSVADLKRIINVPPRGIGKTTLLKIVEGQEAGLPLGMKVKIQNFRNLISKIKDFSLENPPSRTIIFIAEAVGLNENLEKTEEGVERIENIKELSALASIYDNMGGEMGIEKLLEDTALASDQDSDKEERVGVRLMTVHASKGLEFSYVFVTGLEEGLFPHNKDGENLGEEEREEERRLFYVAVTRAKKKLFLTYAQTRTIFGSRGVNIPSEFVLELPDEYIEKEYLDYTPKRKPLLHIEF